jgi:hypothetical protein
MILRATCVGELAASFANTSANGRVTRVFRNSAYLESGSALFLLLRGEIKSPMTINLEGEGEMERMLAVGDTCSAQDSQIVAGRLTVLTSGASTYRSKLTAPSRISPIGSTQLIKGITALRLLYDVSPSSLDLLSSKPFRDFVDSLLSPQGYGASTWLYELGSYLPLVGLGSGFTPAGDDLVGGFAAAYNHFARSKGMKVIDLPLAELAKRTVHESAIILDYAQRGYVDERLERMILSAMNNSPQEFFSELLEVTRRGHTSGIDMSLGVLLCVATIKEQTENGTVKSCLQALMGSRTL